MLPIIQPQADERPCEPPHQAEGPSTSQYARTPLQYDDLPQDRSIRVIDLAPGAWDAPVRCSLRTVRLDDNNLCYEAISYAWGDPTDRRALVCNGSIVSTTRNLFEALQRFRYDATTRTLWADAICINQANNEERTSQVRLMSFIYKRAVRVLVWLQHDDDQIVQDSLNAVWRFARKEDGFARIEVQGPHTPNQSTQVFYRWRDVDVTSITGEESSEVTNVAIDALCRICSSPWFGRGWVIQEVVLGTSVSVFWGHAEIGFNWLGIAVSSVISNHSNGWSYKMDYCLLLYQISVSLRNLNGAWRSLYSLIHSTSHFVFSEPKDRIYGLLGLRTLECDPVNGQSLVDPDYSVTTTECYRRVAGKLLSEWHDLRVLSWVYHSSVFASNWPSWVPNFDETDVNIFIGSREPRLKGKERPSLVDIFESVTDEKQCINIPGLRVDAVDREVEEYANLGNLKVDRHAPTHLQAVLRTLSRLYDDAYLASTLGNWQKELPLDCGRIANLVSEYRTFMKRDFVQHMYLEALLTRLSFDSESSFKPDADRFFCRCLKDRTGRTLFITSTGMLGLGPKVALPGDIVVVLHGASVPFVLRPADNGFWRLVGECYLYEVNEGRFHRKWEEKGSVSERFCIY